VEQGGKGRKKMNAVMYIINYLVFPGFAFAAAAGLISGWIDRKVTARIQWRCGPPWYQNFADIIKLFAKDVIVPEKTSYAFLLAPFLGLLGASLASAVIGMAFLRPGAGFIGDIIVVLYLLVIPAACLIIGASCSRNPLASIGASREMKLVIGYELPFIMILIAVIVRSGGSLNLGEIISLQLAAGPNIASFSGALGFIAGILCAHAKLGFVPFDAAEAEQEIMGGALIEYSGAPLAFFRLTKAVLLYTMPMLLILLFWANSLNPLSIAGKYVAILVIIILIKNTNPRLRVDQALRFFWGPVSAAAFISLVLAFMGY
jgi:NADH-quinone oxidoreductase subunit H